MLSSPREEHRPKRTRTMNARCTTDCKRKTCCVIQECSTAPRTQGCGTVLSDPMFCTVLTVLRLGLMVARAVRIHTLRCPTQRLLVQRGRIRLPCYQKGLRRYRKARFL